MNTELRSLFSVISPSRFCSKRQTFPILGKYCSIWIHVCNSQQNWQKALIKGKHCGQLAGQRHISGRYILLKCRWTLWLPVPHPDCGFQSEARSEGLSARFSLSASREAQLLEQFNRWVTWISAQLVKVLGAVKTKTQRYVAFSFFHKDTVQISAGTFKGQPV